MAKSKRTKYHYRIMDGFIEAYHGHDDYGWTRIASILEPRPVTHLVRASQLAEDIETLMDSYIPDTLGTGPAVLKE